MRLDNFTAQEVFLFLFQPPPPPPLVLRRGNDKRGITNAPRLSETEAESRVSVGIA